MNQTHAQEQNLELIPKSTAEKLDAHIKRIRAYIAGQRKAAAEHFGYAFLAGRVLLQAKEDVPHGNADPKAGFIDWVGAHFPEISRKTAFNWMRFAESVTSKVSVDTPKSPLLIGVGKLNVKTRATILKAVPEVMDGKGMMEFMRCTRLLRDPEKQKHHPRKPISKQEENKAKSAQAKRVWDGIASELDTAAKIASRVENVADLKRYLDATIEAGNAIREVLKRRGAARNS